jgi:hypothetical protein
MRRLISISLFVALSQLACGSDDPDASDGGGQSGERLLPMKVGASWTYRITDPSTGATGNKMSTVEVSEDVGGAKAGTIAMRVRTEKLDGVTVSWQEDVGTGIIRHREQAFDLGENLLLEETYSPHKLRIDETTNHLSSGASWTETYEETVTDANGTRTVSKSESWTVEAVDESITVPAGTFTTVRLRKVGSGLGASDKTYWFAPGVGKIKETGGQTEELMAYQIP